MRPDEAVRPRQADEAPVGVAAEGQVDVGIDIFLDAGVSVAEQDLLNVPLLLPHLFGQLRDGLLVGVAIAVLRA